MYTRTLTHTNTGSEPFKSDLRMLFPGERGEKAVAEWYVWVCGCVGVWVGMFASIDVYLSVSVCLCICI